MLEHAVFSPLDYWPVLAGFIVAVILLLTLDLFVIERLAGDGSTPESERKRFKVSLAWTGLCVLAAVGAAFAFQAFAARELAADPTLLEGTRYAALSPAEAPRNFLLEFLTGYLVEIPLSLGVIVALIAGTMILSLVMPAKSTAQEPASHA